MENLFLVFIVVFGFYIILNTFSSIANFRVVANNKIANKREKIFLKQLKEKSERHRADMEIKEKQIECLEKQMEDSDYFKKVFQKLVENQKIDK